MLGGKGYFFAWDAAHGRELWVTDGTPQGTGLVHDAFPGNGSAFLEWNPQLYAGTRLYFVADDGTTGHELWRLE